MAGAIVALLNLSSSLLDLSSLKAKRTRERDSDNYMHDKSVVPLHKAMSRLCTALDFAAPVRLDPRACPFLCTVARFKTNDIPSLLRALPSGCLLSEVNLSIGKPRSSGRQ